MRIDLKNTRVTARRILQGGAAFAALGALGVATALPAAADTQTVGWAHANVADGYGIAETYITPQGESDSDSSGYSGALDEYFSIEASTSAAVDGNGATSTTTVASASIRLTAADVEEIIAEAQDEEDGADSDEEPSDAPSDEPAEEETDTEEETPAPGDGGGEGDGTDETPPAPEPTDPPAEPTDTPDADAGDTSADDAVAPLVELGEDDIDLSSAGDEIVLSATISGASVTTTQSWNGAVTHSVDPGSVSYEVNELDAVIGAPYQEQGTYTSDDAGFDWGDAYTALLVDITVPGEFEGGYVLGVTYASVGVTGEDPGNGGGDNGGDDGGDGGDDRTPPSRDAAELPKPEPKPTEALATTGSPLAGLIAAGAAIAAGGGAAAYLARRKKNAADASAESSEG